MDDARQKLIAKLASLPQQGGPPNPDASVSVHPVVVEGRLVGGQLHQAYDCSASRGSVKALPGDGLGIELIKPEGGGNGIAAHPQSLPVQPQLDESRCIVCGDPSTHGITCRNKEIGGWDHWNVCTAHKDLNKDAP